MKSNMKKIILLLTAAILMASCETRYEFDFTLYYTVGNKQLSTDGIVTTNDANSVPIAVAYKNSVVVDTYPTRVVDDKTLVIYQGETPASVDSLQYSLNKYYRLNKATWHIDQMVQVSPKKNKEE